MDILFVATELAPYAKAGALADVIAGLTKALRQHGHNVMIVLPRYPHFERAGLLMARRLTPLTFDLAGERYTTTVYDGRLPTGADITLLDLPGFFDREGIYGDENTEYADNPVRFATFCHAVVEMVLQRFRMEASFDIVHAHDWPSALVPFLIKLSGNEQIAAATGCVLTVHTLEFQGLSDPTLLNQLGIPAEYFHPGGVEFFGKVNLLKAGLISADALTTVSESYARQIQTSQAGHGLEGVLASRASQLTGILNGVDYALWNPATDAALLARYDAGDCSGKILCKGALFGELGIEVNPERPIILFADRLVRQKGYDLFLDALPQLARSDVSFVVAGDGDPVLVQTTQSVAARMPEQIAFVHRPSDPVLHRLIAGADMQILPSRLEPGGILQRRAQRYGTVPIAHAIGSLGDTIVDCDPRLETGTGFLFCEPTIEALVGATQRALSAFASPRWASLRRRVMHLDVSWDRSAHQIEVLYRSLLS